jgi:glycosyltransferase involved in cell wall biosynthesis
MRRVRRESLDVLLTIDYRPTYLPVLAAVPRTPVLVWTRDPRTPADQTRLETLRIPGHDGRATGVDPIDCTSLGRVARASRRLRRPLQLASPAPGTLLPRARIAYDMPNADVRLLPNPVQPAPRTNGRTQRPSVVFLGRLDPVKRPWLVVEVARRMPDVEFLLVGEPYIENGWKPGTLPPNAHLLGRVDGADKQRLVGSAWALVNTSLHEGLPVSFVEALAAGTPIASFVDPEDVVSRFGACAGPSEGSGIDDLSRLEAALRDVLEGGLERGDAGRAWVEATHTPERFLAEFRRLAPA